MNVLSLFDGISAGRVALDKAGIKYVAYYASEIDKYAMAIAKKNYPDTIHIGDVTKVRAEDLPKIDLLIGGFPCQPYSHAGKRGGLNDIRSQPLLNAMFRIINNCQPENIMLENVKGLLTIDGGNIFKYILKEIQDCGFAVDWIVINSALVSAQNRERVYILGKRLDTCKGLEYEVDVPKNNKRR